MKNLFRKILISSIVLLGVAGAIFYFGQIKNILASDTGALSPGTVVDDDATGTVAWTNPDNATTSDNVYATASSDVSPSHYLKATNFEFSIPTGATINGILVEIERKNNRANESYDLEVKIVKSNGSLGSQNKATTTEWSTTDTYVSYGTSTDLWNETWTAEDINDADFGVVLSAQIGYISQCSVDHFRITIFFTEAAGGATSTAIIMRLNTIFKSGVIFK